MSKLSPFPFGAKISMGQLQDWYEKLRSKVNTMLTTGVSKLAPAATGTDLTLSAGITTGSTTLHTTTVALNNGAAAAVGTLNNAPAAGNPTKWIPINDNGVTRYIPSW